LLIVTYSRCRTEEEMLAVLAEQVNQIASQGNKVRVLHDYRDAFLGEQFIELTKKLSKDRRERSLERVAVLGLTGIKKALYTSYRIASGDYSTRIFDTEEAALDWLAS